MKPEFDQEFMSLALQEGVKGLGLTAPNPSVGAVLVKEGQVVGKGYHKKAGEAHAEQEAIADCLEKGNDPTGSDIYITLEPCSTVGRTPPCTQAIVEAGIRRVVWAADDPNPNHRGAARTLLEGLGVEVVTEVLASEAEELHRAFFKVQRTRMPWVIVKTALSLDGRIVRPPGESQWLTGEEARANVQVLRGEVDAILTSGRTARRDNPRLTYRGERKSKKQPLRVVFTDKEQGNLSQGAYLLEASESGPTRFLSGNLREELRSLAQEGYHTLLLEAGGGLVGEFLDQGLVDEWVSYFAPLVVGGDVPAVGGRGIQDLECRPRLERISYQSFGSDVRVRGFVTQV